MKENKQTVEMEDTVWTMIPQEYLKAIVHEIAQLKKKYEEINDDIAAMNRRIKHIQTLDKTIRSLKHTWGIRGIGWYLTLFNYSRGKNNNN